MSDCVTRSITGHVSPLSTIPTVALATPRSANAATRTDAPSAVSQTGCLAWHVPFCGDRRCLIRTLLDRPHKTGTIARRANNVFWLMFLSSVKRRFSVPACWITPAPRHSGGQDWPKATAKGGAKRS